MSFFNNVAPARKRFAFLQRQVERSFSWHLTALTLGVALPALVYIAVLLWQFTKAERARVEDEAIALAHTLSVAVDREILGVSTTLRALATSPSLQDDNLAAFYKQMQDARPDGVHLSLRRADGAAIAATRLPFGETITTQTAEVQETDEEARRSGRPQVSDVFYGPINKAPTVQIVAPLKGDPAQRVLGASLETAFFKDVLERFEAAPRWAVAIVDRNNVFVSRMPNHDAVAGRSASNDFRTKAVGERGHYYGLSATAMPVLVGYHRSRDNGWSVAVSYSTASLTASLWRSLALLAGAGAVLALAGVLLMREIRSRIVLAIGALRTAAASVSPPAPQQTPITEITDVISALSRSAQAAAESERRLRDFAASNVIGILFADFNGGVSYANNEYLRIIGRTKEELATGAVRWDAITPPEWAPVDAKHIEEAKNKGECTPFEKEYLRPDGTRAPVLVGFSLIGVSQNEVVAFVLDISQQKKLERTRELLRHELSHRVKNTLATVQAVANMTLRANPDPVAFRRKFTERLAALARTHTLLTANSWQETDLRELIIKEIEPYAAVSRVDIEGEPVTLAPDLTLSFGMCIHELVTNAVKYGAFSDSEGRLSISWSVLKEARADVLRVVWRERGGPPVQQPSIEGFGSKLLARSLRDKPGGKCDIEYHRSGVKAVLEVQLMDAPLFEDA